MDIRMRRVDGLAACRRTTAADPGARIVVLTLTSTRRSTAVYTVTFPAGTWTSFPIPVVSVLNDGGPFLANIGSVVPTQNGIEFTVLIRNTQNGDLGHQTWTFTVTQS